MTGYLESKQAAALLGVTERHVVRMCANDDLPGAVRNGSQWFIPVTAHPKLAAAGHTQKLTDSAELQGVPADKRKEAIRKLGLIQEFEQFAAEYMRTGALRSQAVARYTFDKHVPTRSFYRWLLRWRQQGLVGLVDTRGGGKFLNEIISAEAFEMFKSMYLTQQRLSLKMCWQNVNYINKDQRKGWVIPSLHATYNYVKRQIPLPVQVLHREGLAAYQAKCAPYIQIDPDSIEPGAVWVGDHHQFNCFIRHRGQWVRPWITAWEDMRSRSIVGRNVNPSPNQTTILLALRQAVEKHGPPDSVKVDNGRDYDSLLFTGTTKEKRRILKAGYLDEQIVAGLFAMMEVGVSFAIKYRPQSKPIERWFDTLNKQFTKTIRTYCGQDTDSKPDDINELLKNEKVISQAYNLETFTQAVDRYIEVYNNTAHSGAGMDGWSPNEVLALRTSRRVLAEGVLDLVARVWSRELVVGKNGVNFNRMYYGQYNPDLLAHQGRKVRVAYDPADLRTLHVYDAVTLTLITTAEQNRLISYGSPVSEEDFRLAQSEKARALRIARQYRDSRLTANMDLTDLTLKAMQEAAKDGDTADNVQTLRPVRTPLDLQVPEHKKQQALRFVRKAAGAESVSQVLDIDFTMLKPKTVSGKNIFDD